MAKRKEHQRALELRRAGKSYNQIRRELGVSKSTLSVWLKDHPLSKERIRELRDWNQERIEKYIQTRRGKKEEAIHLVYDQQKAEIFPLSQRDIFIAGLFLYWGEGGKTKEYELALSNTNPAAISFFLYWLEKYFGINRNATRVKLHLYKDMDAGKEVSYWSKKLNISKGRFSKPYIKQSKLSGLSYKTRYKHGTCNIILCNGILSRKVLTSLKVIEDRFAGQ